LGYKGSDGDWIPGAVDQDPVLKQYTQMFPDHWEKVQKLLGLRRGGGRHASAYLVCNEPIQNFIPLTSISGIKCTQFTANSAEEAGALKYDFLVVNSLNDISECIKLLQGKFGKPSTATLNGKLVPAFRQIPVAGDPKIWADIWDLPEDQSVFADVCESNTETVFQFNTPAAKQWLRFFDRVNPETGNKALDSIEDLAAFTALDRPGPLKAMMDAPDGTQHNMLVEYARRAAEGNTSNSIVDQLLPETHGIIVYQEQLTKVFRNIGQSTAIEAENFRMHISKKQMAKVIEDKEIFMRGAVNTIGAEAAEDLWNKMEGFGAYCFNKSHSVCYVVIGYACAYLKHYYPLEWWTSVLRNASKNEISGKFWKHVSEYVRMPQINHASRTFEIVDGKVQAPLSVLQGIGATAHDELVWVGPRLKTIDDLFTTVAAYKEATGKTRSALTKGTVYTLILSGAADCLFPAESTTLEKIQMYHEAKARYESIGKKKLKKVEPIDPHILNLNAYSLLQTRKTIFPAYSTDMLKLVKETMPPDVIEISGKLCLNYLDAKSGLRTLHIYDHDIVDRLAAAPVHKQFLIAAPAYVLEDERRTFGFAKKPMAKLKIDVSGQHYELVCWPDRDTEQLPASLTNPVKGEVGFVILQRYSSDKPFTVYDFVRIQPAYTEESSK
jgi:DNA polymerase III alpha subunit